MKLMVEKLRHVIFGKRSEKFIIKLDQLELELEEEETAHAELEAAAGRGATRRSTSHCQQFPQK
jgi:hypothetical protein